MKYFKILLWNCLTWILLPWEGCSVIDTSVSTRWKYSTNKDNYRKIHGLDDWFPIWTPGGSKHQGIWKMLHVSFVSTLSLYSGSLLSMWHYVKVVNPIYGISVSDVYIEIEVWIFSESLSSLSDFVLKGTLRTRNHRNFPWASWPHGLCCLALITGGVGSLPHGLALKLGLL